MTPVTKKEMHDVGIGWTDKVLKDMKFAERDNNYQQKYGDMVEYLLDRLDRLSDMDSTRREDVRQDERDLLAGIVKTAYQIGESHGLAKATLRIKATIWGHE